MAHQHPQGGGGQRPPPGAGGRPPLPVDMRGGPVPVQICDLSQDYLSEKQMAAQLTEYFTYRFEKLIESGEYDDNGHPKRPTWDKAIRSQVRHMSQEEMAQRIRYLDQHSQPLAAKKNSLSPVLQRQIDRAQRELMDNEPDQMNYQWVLAQVEHQLKEWPVYTEAKPPRCPPPRKHCSLKKRSKPSAHRGCKKKKFYERISLTTYFKRIPRSGAQIQVLWNSKFRRSPAPPNAQPLHPHQNQPPNPQPPVRPQQQQPLQQQPLQQQPLQQRQPLSQSQPPPPPPQQHQHPSQPVPQSHPPQPNPGPRPSRPPPVPVKRNDEDHLRKHKEQPNIIRISHSTESDRESVQSSVFSSSSSGRTSATYYSEPPLPHHHHIPHHHHPPHHGPTPIVVERRHPPVRHVKVVKECREERGRGRRPHHAPHHIPHDERPPPAADRELENAYRAGQRAERMRPRIVQAHPPRSRSRPPHPHPRPPSPPPGFTRTHRIPIDPADLHYSHHHHRHHHHLRDDDEAMAGAFGYLNIHDDDDIDSSEDYDEFEYREHNGHGHERRHRHRHRHRNGDGHRGGRGGQHVDEHGSSIMSEDPFAGSPVSSTSTSSSSSSSFPRNTRPW
ncbi:hypothetical protein F4810DRAFT_713996 [Camillea tinctor]|nr:hypothetical protein F4810DRAFT_713996 [Camillea tinctor]